MTLVSVRQVAVVVAMALVATGCAWSQYGGSPGLTRNQAGERLISPATAPGLHELWSTPCCSRTTSPSEPVSDGQRIFVAAPIPELGPSPMPDRGALTAYDLLDGHVVWAEPDACTWLEVTPAVGENVVVAAGGCTSTAMNAFDATTGARLWSVPLFGPPTSPTVVAGRAIWKVGGAIYVQDLHTGAERIAPERGTSWQTSVSVADGHLYDGVGTTYDLATGTVLYEEDAVVPGERLTDGKIVVRFLDDELTALRASDGAFLWSAVPPCLGSVGALSDDLVIVTCDDVTALDRKTGEVVWHSDAFAIQRPTIANGVVFLTGFSTTTMLALVDGAPLGELTAGASTAPVVVAGHVIIKGSRLHVFGF